MILNSEGSYNEKHRKKKGVTPSMLHSNNLGSRLLTDRGEYQVGGWWVAGGGWAGGEWLVCTDARARQRYNDDQKPQPRPRVHGLQSS